DCNRGCWDIATRFVGYGAFDNIVWWLSQSEVGSIDFTVRGYSYPGAEPETLAVVPAKGGYGILQHYWVEVPGSHEYYDVIERDLRARHTRTPVFKIGAKPPDWDEWVRRPRVDLELVDRPVDDGSEVVFELVGDTFVPLMLGDRAYLSLEPPPQPPDDSACADVVIYSSVRGFLSPVVQHCQREGLKVRAFLGSSNPDDARLAYSEVYEANNTYEDECLEYPGGCDRHYGRPLLIIVGDAGDSCIVAHEHFPDEHDRCSQPSCRSDYDITDLDGDGIPEGPVTRIPAETLEEVELAVNAAEEFNNGVKTDHGFHVVLMAGDYDYGRYETGPLPEEVLGDVSDGYASVGYQPRPILVESHYETHGERTEAARDQINAGVLEMWGFGYVTSGITWPGGFITNSQYDMNHLTTPQHVIAWIPNCEITAAWQWYGSLGAPIVEAFMFNDSTRTNLAACVGHLSGGWDFQHEDFAHLLLHHRLQAEPGTPVAEVVYEAVREAQLDYPWLFDYARSVGVLGGYVRIPGNPTASAESAKGKMRDGTASVSLTVDSRLPCDERVVEGTFRIERPGNIRLDIYDVRGRLVANLRTGYVEAGEHHFNWRLMSSKGDRVSPGVYFLRLTYPKGAILRKVVVSR
ncbi:MAG: C25 family cysteine peptidase, partial [Candidatus Thorarchaeota archaeon]